MIAIRAVMALTVAVVLMTVFGLATPGEFVEAQVQVFHWLPPRPIR